jgi:predicted dehydrogenase
MARLPAGTPPDAAAAARRPRLGFLGVGWIGRHRMQAILDAGAAEAAAIADPSPETAAEAGRLAPGAELVATLDDLLDVGVDGVVIATPSALHAEQSIRALRRGAAVFCQKPLGRTAAEARGVVDAARAADRLLEVDLSYRFTAGMRRIRDAVRSGALGRVFAADLAFHNAYGPDKPWFYDPALSGGGCVMDLGVHLVDLALWTLDFPEVSCVSAALFAGGEPLLGGGRPDRAEDYAVATVGLATGAVVRLACSWRLHAGRDAAISAAFYGTEGGAALRNVGGSFYDFTAERYCGTARETLAAPPDAWGGRAAAHWAARLAAGERFDPEAERLVDVAGVLDRIYGR